MKKALIIGFLIIIGIQAIAQPTAGKYGSDLKEGGSSQIKFTGMYRSDTHDKTSIEIFSDGQAVWTTFGSEHRLKWILKDSAYGFICIYDESNVCEMFRITDDGSTLKPLANADESYIKDKISK